MRLSLAVLAGLIAFPVHAEKADQDKATQIEANRMSADDTQRMNIFEGNVVLTKGTISLRADRIVVRQDAEGYQFSTATGSPVRFKQRQDPKDGEKEGKWVDGEALRIEIDDRNQKIELFNNARINRGGDEVAGSYILVDQRSDFFSVKGGAGERVKALIQPKVQADDSKK